MTKNQTFADFSESLTHLNNTFKSFIRQRLKAHQIDITTEMLLVLRFLWTKNGVNQQEIADAIQKDKASLTYLIDNLTHRNLLQRQGDPTDRRNKLIVLTSDGQKLKKIIEPWIEEIYSGAVKDVKKEELETAISVFKSISKNVKHLE
jgi:DNA-binding MarR family transcriptional regulator